jgi:hypothetical protein
MPMLPVQSLPPLALFALLLFAAAIYGLAALGHFPASTRQEAMRRGAGPAVLWGTMAVVALSVAIALATAWLMIPWYAAIIGGGIAVLVAPLVLQYFSDRFVDGRGALHTFAGAAAVLAVVLIWYMSP